MSTTTLTSKGQITLTRSIRDRLDLKRGDRLHVTVSRDGALTLRREAHPPLENLYGMLHRLARRKPASLDDLRIAILARAKRKHSATRA